MAFFQICVVYLFMQFTRELATSSPIDVTVNLKLKIKKLSKAPIICQTLTCNKTAQEFLDYMDLQADPCRDFYEFSCGRFMKQELPPDKSDASTFVYVQDNLDNYLKEILENLNTSEEYFEKQTKLFYQSCINTAAFEVNGFKGIQEALNKFGGWPLLKGDKWNEKESNLTSILIQLQMLEMPGIFGLVFHNIDTSSKFRIPVILKPKLPFPVDYYEEYSTNAEKIADLKLFILNVSHDLGKIEKDTIARDVDDLVDFQAKLAECSITEVNEKETFDNLISLDKLKKIFEKVLDFEVFLKSIFGEVNIDIKSDETIGTFEMDYLDCLSKLLENTSKRKIVNYLIWNFIEQSMIALPLRIEEFRDTFKKKTEGLYEVVPRWKKCVEIVNKNLHQAVGYLYMKRHFKSSTKVKVLDLIQKIKRAYEKLLKKQKWLTAEAKDQAISKLLQMKDHVGYPSYFDNPKALNDAFDGVDFSSRTFLEIFYNTRTMKMKDDMKLLRVEVDPNVMSMPVAHVNAFYDYHVNRIVYIPVFPAGILMPPLYSDSYPMYLNFGGIGSFIGHEMTHGFDDFGSQFDKNGARKDWWREDDRENFVERNNCLVEQYNEQVLPQTNQEVNGELTNAENIADDSGLRLAHMAYMDWLRKHGEEKQLPGIPYNSEQMFFIAYGRKFCQKTTDEVASVQILQNPSAPSIFRVNVPLKNMKVFSIAFKCKAKSGMNPFKKCRVW